MNNPFTSAFNVAKKMRALRAATEETGPNFKAESDRCELVRQIDWQKFNEVIEQLEFCYNFEKKHKS